MAKILIQVLARIGLLAAQISFIYYVLRKELAIIFILQLHNNNLGVDLV